MRLTTVSSLCILEYGTHKGDRMPKLLTYSEISELSKYPDACGYIRVYLGWDHPQRMPSQPTAFEHRLKMEAKMGRRLAPGEVVHHRNANRGDNRIKNLQLTTHAGHGVAHRSAPSQRCLNCGKKFYRWPCVIENGGGRYCGPKCGATSPKRVLSAKKNLKPRKANVALNKKVYRAKESGMTWAQVSEQFGVAVGTVRDRHRWYKENVIDVG